MAHRRLRRRVRSPGVPARRQPQLALDRTDGRDAVLRDVDEHAGDLRSARRSRRPRHRRGGAPKSRRRRSTRRRR